MAQTAVAAREKKAAAVDEIRSKLRGADASVLTEYRGLTVGELAALRAALRSAGAEYKVFKNTLARRAVEAEGLTDLLPLLDGPVAFTFIDGDAVIAAKALSEFSRDHDALVLKGGLLGERVLVAAEVQELARIQPREVLLARLAGGFQAPLAKAAGLFSAFTRNFAYGLAAYIDTRPAESASDTTSADPHAKSAPAASDAPEEVVADAAPEPAESE